MLPVFLLISDITELEKDYLIINKRNPEFLNFDQNDNIFQKAEKILESCCQSTNINLEGTNVLLEDNYNNVNLLILSDCNDDKMSILSNQCNYKVVFYKYDSNQKIKTSRSYALVKKIIEESEEFNENCDNNESIMYRFINFIYS